MAENALANLFTIGARDVRRLRLFYESLGWPTVLEEEDFVVFELGGALLGLFDANKLAADAHASVDTARTGIRSSITVIVDDPQHVDSVAERMDQAGGTVTKAPRDAEFFIGRDAYVADPEGNFWEIAWTAEDNPVTAAARRAAGRPSAAT